MLLRVNNIHEKIRDALPWLSISKLRASSAKIIYSNRALGQNNRVDQNNNMQWYLHIVKAQKNSKSGWTVQGIVQSVSESLSRKWNRRFRGLTMFVFNFGVGSLEQSVKLGRLVIFDFLGNSLFSSAIYSVFVVWAVFQLRWRKKTYLKRWLLFCSQIFKFSNFVATSKARVWVAICGFRWLLTNLNVWFVTFFALN